jgi:hypothetical protein
MAKVTNLLSQCSGALKRLDLNMGIPAGTSAIFKLKEDSTEIQPKAWTSSSKELILLHWVNGSSWTRFFKRCRQVETLKVCSLNGTARVLAQAMSNHMPQLSRSHWEAVDFPT